MSASSVNIFYIDHGMRSLLLKPLQFRVLQVATRFYIRSFSINRRINNFNFNLGIAIISIELFISMTKVSCI